MTPIDHHHEGYFISTDPAKLNIDVIQRYLS